MRLLIYGTFSVFLIMAGLMPADVIAIDGDYSNPYADNLVNGECPEDDRECIDAMAGTGAGRTSGLPVMTILGGGLLVIGVFAAAVWKIREKKAAPRDTV